MGRKKIRIPTGPLGIHWIAEYKHKETGAVRLVELVMPPMVTNEFYIGYRGFLEMECEGISQIHYEFVLAKKVEDMFDIGTQIAKIPDHADGDIRHKDVEFGFITRITPNGAFCRYWRNGSDRILRTVSNSELTNFRNIVKHDLVPQKDVDELIERINNDPG